jgi:Carboxypeptidase regulatory-like domain
MKTPQLRNSVKRSPLRCGFILSALALAGFALLPASGAVAAGTSALEGVVKDPAGHPIKGADVRIEAKNFSKIVKTDASGHYISDGLAVATYKVTLVVNGSVKASIMNAKTQSGKPTQLNFDLTAKMAPVKKHTHMVWCPPDTGTLIGGGRWIEVDDNGNVVNASGANNVQKMSGSALGNSIRSSARPSGLGGGQ